jgi:hypothetical protein
MDPLLQGGEDDPIRNAMAGLRALGVGDVEALFLTARAHGQGAMVAAMDGPLRRVGVRAMVPFLDAVAEADPDLAQGLLTAWGRDRKVGGSLELGGKSWVVSIPDGLRVEGTLWLARSGVTFLPPKLETGFDLFLQDTLVSQVPMGLKVGGSLFLSRSPIVSLPEGLTVGHWLDLGMTPIRALPLGLKVGEGLDLRRCSSWDGRIPRDARVTDEVHTDLHPDGLCLEAWRRLHPHGERH